MSGGAARKSTREWWDLSPPRQQGPPLLARRARNEGIRERGEKNDRVASLPAVATVGVASAGELDATAADDLLQLAEGNPRRVDAEVPAHIEHAALAGAVANDDPHAARARRAA